MTTARDRRREKLRDLSIHNAVAPDGGKLKANQPARLPPPMDETNAEKRMREAERLLGPLGPKSKEKPQSPTPAGGKEHGG